MKNRITFILVILAFMSCEKDDSLCSGCFDGTVSCKIDGKDWRARCEGDLISGCTPYDCRYYPSKQLELYARSFESNRGNGIAFAISSLTGGAQIGENQLGILRGAFRPEDNSCGWYSTDSTNARTATILDIDTIAQVIEGEFEYTAIGECGQMVEITDGYFKVRYKTK